MQANGIAERLAGEAQNAAGSGRDVVREAGENRAAEDTNAASDTSGEAVPSNDGSMRQLLNGRIWNDFVIPSKRLLTIVRHAIQRKSFENPMRFVFNALMVLLRFDGGYCK